jgi:hypothetical protein
MFKKETGVRSQESEQGGFAASVSSDDSGTVIEYMPVDRESQIRSQESGVSNAESAVRMDV